MNNHNLKVQFLKKILVQLPLPDVNLRRIVWVLVSSVYDVIAFSADRKAPWKKNSRESNQIKSFKLTNLKK